MAKMDKRITQRQLDENRVEDLAEFREKMGLEPIVVKERNCLTCYRSFTSYGKGNRLCDRCRLKESSEFENDN